MAFSFPISAQVKSYQGKPTLWINDEPFYPYLYLLPEPTIQRSWEFFPQYNSRKFAESGVRLFGGDCWFDDMWRGPDEELDITYAVNQIRGFIEACPDCAVLLRVHANPPMWWVRAHPEEQTQFANIGVQSRPPYTPHENKVIRDTTNVEQCSLVSEKWMQVMGEKFEAFFKLLAQRPEASHLMGIHLTMGVHGENHYWGFQKHDPDIGPCMQKAFQKHLRETYKTESALKEAWRDADVTFDTARVPGMERHDTRYGMFRDPAQEQRTVDYYACQHSAITNGLKYFSSIIKKNWPRPLLVGVFYGYYLSLFGRHAAGGHLAEEELLDWPDIDYFAGSMSYGDMYRGLGMPALSHDLVESVLLHGKMFLDEMDQATHQGSHMAGIPFFEKTPSRGVIRRNLGMGFLRGGGTWYYDFGPFGYGGWWDDAEYQYEVRRIGEVFGKYFHKPLGHEPDVLLVHDTKVFLYTSSDPAKDPITERLAVDQFLSAAFRSGAAVHSIYFSDLDKVDVSKYKTIVMANTFYMTPERRESIRRKVSGGGRHVVWVTAPAYVDGKRLDTAFVEKVTGMSLELAPMQALPELTIGGSVLPAGRYGGEALAALGLPKGQQSRPTATLFAVTDPDAMPQAYFADGRVAIACKAHADGTDWYTALPLIDPALLRAIFAASGAHIYASTGDTVLAGNGLVMLHGKDPGQRTITLRDGKRVTALIDEGGTVFVDARTGEIVLD